MLIAICSGLVVGLLGLAVGWWMGYSVGHTDGQTGRWACWPWSNERRTN